MDDTRGFRYRYKLTCKVNGEPVITEIEARTTLLDLLRDRLRLTGTKKGCNERACGACTVLVDGKRMNACLTLAIQCEAREVTTIEGVGTPEALHPVQRTFNGAAKDGALDLVALMRASGQEEITGKGEFDLDGAPASINGSGSPYAMQSWGANFVEVGVDRDLGLIRLRRVLARYSAGGIINPLAARSQMIGAITWEWGKATMEASLIEARYGRFFAKNLSNVPVPVNADIPHDAIDVGFVDEFDLHTGPTGARGIGELGSTGVAAAIANAVYDAVGVRFRQVPILPHHILEALA